MRTWREKSGVQNLAKPSNLLISETWLEKFGVQKPHETYEMEAAVREVNMEGYYNVIKRKGPAYVS